MSDLTCAGLMEATSKLLRRHGLNEINGFVSLDEFILKSGRQWPVGKLPQDVPVGIPKQCYRNAALKALEEPRRFIYCEGYARGIMPVLHAWLLDRKGNVIEVTWQDGTGTDYYGLAIRHDFLRRQIQKQETYGLLDQPEHKWPLLHVDQSKWRHPIMDL